MKKIIGFFVVLLTSVTFFSVHASETDGRKEAFQFCQTLSFSTSRDNCANIVRNSVYFNTSALEICSIFNFDAYRLDCVQSIANRHYLDAEIEICKKETFDSKKLQCLKNSGNTVNPPVQNIDIVYLKSSLRHALSSLRSGNGRSTEATLIDMIKYLESF